MNENLKLEIIESGKDYFRTKIIPNHLNNLNKLKLDSFKINPFTINYLAAFCVVTQIPFHWLRLWFTLVFWAQV